MKKAILTTFLALFLICPLSAQNWAMFHQDSTYNFFRGSTTSTLHGVRVDSVKSINNKTHIYFNRTLNDTVNQNHFVANYPITDITQPNIFGLTAIQVNDSIIFQNQFDDLLYLKPWAKLAETWRLITFNNKYIVASIDSIYEDSLKTGRDSIKHISFLCYDSTNSPTGHSINNKILKLSKNHGVIQTPNFYEGIIGNSLNNTYKNNFLRSFRSTYYSKRELMDLNIGDEYHLYKNLNPAGPPDELHWNQKVINRSVSANGDTITLTLNEKSRRTTVNVDFSTNPPTSTTSITYSTDTIHKKIIKPQDTVDKLPAYMPRVVDTSTAGFQKMAIVNNHSLYLSYARGPYGNRLIFHPVSFEAFYDSLQGSWIFVPGLSNTKSYSYVKGVCELEDEYYNQGSTNTIILTNLLYYNVGGNTWGTPNIITQLEEITQASDAFLVYPNPTSSQISIESKENIELIRIIDLKGQVQLEYHNPNLQNLNVSFLENGVYLLEAHSENKEVKRQKLVIKH